jgi:preprotein translocase subunit SecE
MRNILKEIINEYKQTKRLNFVELLKLTIYTVVFCGIIALIILGMDVLFQWGLAQFLKI